MRVESICTCRGDGKIYAMFDIFELQAGCTVEVAARTSTCDIPCAIYPFEHDSSFPHSYVVVLPILHTLKCTLSFREVSADGKTLCANDQPFFFSAAKWQSRLNYRLRRSLCSRIRGYDEISEFTSCSMNFVECIEDEDDVILRGTIFEPCPVGGPLSLQCLTSTLEEIPISPIFLGDSPQRASFSDKVVRRAVQFSIRLPKEPQRLVFVIRDPSHPEFDSFEVLDKPQYDRLLKETSALMAGVQFDPAYDWWFRSSHRAKPGELAAQTELSSSDGPLFSIVVPLFQTPLNLFEEMVDSVLRQSYRTWELLLVNASPENKELTDSVNSYSSTDDRIRAIHLERNLGISENTRAGVEAAQGDFICFFDHDDVLEPNILFEYSRAIEQNPQTDVLYCDEDKLHPDGYYLQPFFKPDFDLDLLRNNNYICHLLTIRRGLLENLKLSTSEYDGAQDHNLTLQAAEKARHIHHVPKVLYHWRMTEGSTAANPDSKSYAVQAGVKAVSEHLKRVGLNATVSPSRSAFTYKVIYEPPKEHPLVSIIIPSKDQVPVLSTCIQSILEKTSYDNYEIVIVENNSTDDATFGYYETLTAEHPDQIKVVTWPGEFNFSKIVNFGVEHSRGSYLLLLNNDTEVITPGWISIMLGLCARDDVGIVGVRLLYRDNTIQHAGLTITGQAAGQLGKYLPKDNYGYFCLLDAQRQLSAVTAACMLVDREAFEEVGGFTEELQVAFNDVDFCLKVRETGRHIVYTPEVELYHYESLSRGIEDNTEKKERFHREVALLNMKWAKYYVSGDPYFNPNFTKGEPFNWYCKI